MSVIIGETLALKCLLKLSSLSNKSLAISTLILLKMATSGMVLLVMSPVELLH